MKKRIIFLHRYDRSTASFRARCESYFDSLRAENYEVLSQSLFESDYWTAKPRSLKKFFIVAKSLVRRFLFLFRLRRSDQIILYVELFPYVPDIFERALHFLGIQWIYDIDDAFFHVYENHASRWIRKTLGNKLSHLMHLSKFVIVGNDYLAAYARQHHRKVTVIPSVVDLDKYPLQPSNQKNSPLTVGWIGTPATGAFVSEIEEALMRLASETTFRLLIVGAGRNPLQKENHKNLQVEIRDWVEEREFDDIKDMDIGIMPLPDNPYTRGKGGMKILQYMAAGIPSIASPIGFNQQVIQHGKNGFLASSTGEWVELLRKCLQDRSLRDQLGREGRKTVESEFCLQVTRPNFLETLRELQ